MEMIILIESISLHPEFAPEVVLPCYINKHLPDKKPVTVVFSNEHVE